MGREPVMNTKKPNKGNRRPLTRQVGAFLQQNPRKTETGDLIVKLPDGRTSPPGLEMQNEELRKGAGGHRGKPGNVFSR